MSMVIVHYNNVGNYTACYQSKDNVYVSNQLENVNCANCKESESYKEKIRGNITMTACKYCETELPVDHSAVISQIIEANLDWESFESTDSRWGYVDDAKINIEGLGYLTLTARKMKPEYSEMGDGYYADGEYAQGTTFETFVVLEYAGRYFKKTGQADSYGSVNWHAGIVKEVKPEIKTVKVWK